MTPRTPRWFCLFLLLLPAALGAQERGVSFGLGAEADLITTDTWGVGGLFMVDYRFNDLFAVGVRGEASYSQLAEEVTADSPKGFDSILAFEGETFFRWYFWRPRYAHLFLQADVGLIATLRGGDVQNSRGTFEAGASTGVRFLLPRNWYVETFVRSGYPHLAGVGLVFGLRIPQKQEVSIVEKIVEVKVEIPVEVEKIVVVEKIVEVEVLVEVEKIVEVEVPVEIVKIVEVERIVEAEVPVEVERIVEVEVPVEIVKIVEVVVPIETEKIVEVEVEKKPVAIFSLYFGPDATTLFSTNLDNAAKEQNMETMIEVVHLLEENPNYHLLVEGHANPVLRTPDEAQTKLSPLSLIRAQHAANQLATMGIAQNRLSIMSSGGERAAAPISNRPQGFLNRRVELYVFD